MRIEPSTVRAGDRLTCVWDGFVDAEHGEDRSRVEWFRNDEPVGDGRIWWGELQHGDSLRCTVTPSDGELDGAPLSAHAKVANSPPTIGYASVVPFEPRAYAELTCLTGGVHDPDGEPVTVDVAWTIDGLEAGSGPTLTGIFHSGQKVACEATPHDGTDHGPSVTASLTIGNSPPLAAGVRITPTQPRVLDRLNCEVETTSDPDGDPVSVRFAWKLGGTTLSTGPTYFGSLHRGDEVSCVATPNDGVDDGVPAIASVTIRNTPPVVKVANIAPLTLRSFTRANCSSTVLDADGDKVTVTYAWTRNGAPAGTGPALNAPHSRDDEIVCIATPDDGTDIGDAVSSEARIVLNSPPEVDWMEISPANPVATDTLTCNVILFDADDDPVTVSRRWLINNVEVSTDEALLGGFKHQDLVTCEVAPSDGVATGWSFQHHVRIRNLPPLLQAVEVRPSPAYPDTPLTCDAIGAIDPDDEPVTLRVEWFINDFAAGSGPTLISGFQAGDTVRCEATAWDPRAPGQFRTASVVIAERAL